ncbi:Silent information regulator protein Sir2 [Desulfurispirillum indicum S5]|uniref:protein acetyllysine N-acetyltransferase n=1 Tax=Desulfurispirillum indicum (strain ATCC BAA-1389 / DSM 22839 / S5) TaxID=653733 RepID=E6W529_DESIS|nr:Sir2 family NAD-dependent protein deacetylase [Desulfurispirillum indicum]ADU66005.1 Silent information regulator protein Sir2 [Desulfurispirillum indicum S5]
MEYTEKYRKAADVIRNAEAMIITSGAGMGVDSGLPDFRGEKGFWNAYPMYERLGLSFAGAANPRHFDEDPAFGWGFYGHRTNLYRSTTPHDGFNWLKEWSKKFGIDHFVVTSNVDGQFQQAGYADSRILEVHGSIHHLQCTTPCSSEIWANEEDIPVDLDTMRAGYIPSCIRCNAVARPNILMFGDYAWISSRTAEQEERFSAFLNRHRGHRKVIIEMGAGTSVPTIRNLGDRLSTTEDVTLIRINPREYGVRGAHISIDKGALEALQGIGEHLAR